MDTYLLPATKYEPPPNWQVQRRTLNTIIEDDRSDNDEGSYIDEDLYDEERGRSRSSYTSRSAGSSTSPVPSLTSSISSYSRQSRRSHEFDELYDVSDEEPADRPSINSSRLSVQSMITHPAGPRKSPRFKANRNCYPTIIIPSHVRWSTKQKLQTISPAPHTKIPLSPAVLSLLNRDLPAINQTPSLDDGDGSSTDPHAHSTAPPTPDTRSPENGEAWGPVEVKQRPESSLFKVIKEPDIVVRGEDWGHTNSFHFDGEPIIRDFSSDAGVSIDSPVLGMDDRMSDAGVQLSEEALLTLQQLSIEIPPVPDFVTDSESNSSRAGEMQEVPFDLTRNPTIRRWTADMTPVSEASDYSLDQLSIPSPGGFFSSLGGAARHTWAFAKTRPPSVVLPSTTTAEYFYNCPWREPNPVVEQIVEVDDTSTEGPPTARQMPFKNHAAEYTTVMNPKTPPSPYAESVHDDDENLQRQVHQVIEDHLDRTTVWLAAQSSYLAALRETNPVNDVRIDPLEESKRASRHLRNDSLDSPMKKAVRFLEEETAERDKQSNDTHQGDSTYYHAFQHISNKAKSQDPFRHRQVRAEAVQASRNCLPKEHLERLQGNYNITKADRPAPPRPVSLFPGKDSDENEQTTEQKVISRVERERQALEQLNTSMWVVEASRFLSGGKLLNSPAIRAISHTPESSSASKVPLSAPHNQPNMRILDLGGLPNCDWAWHCAREYPTSKVYTATTYPLSINPSIRGPSNHRSTCVPSLYTLPYPDHHFSAISARSLFAHLKTSQPPGLHTDEYDLCLRECLRTLKPGGYLEFFLLDSEIVNAGPRGTAVSVEFGFNLKTRGYDAIPTKNFLGRLRRAGFDDIKRAWTFLPIGSPAITTIAPPETPPPRPISQIDGIEAVQGPVGSTAGVANIAGLVGSWAWEQWMVKLQVEMGKEGLPSGVGSVIEEGKRTGGGWRCLSGWARKPCEF